jgi:hypothetical protein
MLFIRAGLVVLAYIPASLLVEVWLALMFFPEYNEKQQSWMKQNKLLTCHSSSPSYSLIPFLCAYEDRTKAR